jgi:murein DD-endopeptidase MepM/ murein hydrolase activator NlpD
MQKNDKAYAFLLSHRTRSRIYFKRVEVSKHFLYFGSFGTLIILGITALSFGTFRILNNTALLEKVSHTSLLTQVAAEPKQNEPILQEPSSANDFAFNSGGPEEDNELDGENKELDEKLRLIGANTDPAYLPTMWAHLGKINNEFGFRRNPFGGRAYEFHPGMDIDGERGDMVVAPASGTITAAGYKGGYGNMVEIDHGNGLTTRYGHLSKIETEIGDTVTRGQLLAYIGSTGRSTGPHLHYELRLDERPINPRHFLPPEPTDLTKIVKQ